MKKELLIIQNPEDLLKSIEKVVKKQLQDYVNIKEPEESEQWLSRNDVAKMLSVNLSTIHRWTESKKLKSYGIGNRVYYRKDEVLKALQPLNND